MKHNLSFKISSLFTFFVCVLLSSTSHAFFVDTRPDPKIGDVNMSSEDRQELTNILGPISPDTPVSEVQRRLIESQRGNTESVSHGTLPHPGNVLSYPEAQEYLKDSGEYLSQDNIVRVMQNGRLDPNAEVQLGAAGCPIGWRTTPMGDCGFPLQADPKASDNPEAWIVRDRMTAGTMFAFNVPGSYLDNPNNVSVQFPGIVKTMGEEQKKNDITSRLSEPDLIKLEILSSASALGSAAKSSCKALGEKDKSYEVIKMAANRFKESLMQRNIFVQDEMNKAKELVDMRMKSDKNDVNYQLEAYTLQMSSIEAMIRSYVGEKHGSISIRNRFAKTLEEAQIFAMEEFEEFDEEVNTCKNQVSNSRESAQDGCERIGILQTGEEVSQPVEGSCEAVEIIAQLPELLEGYQEHFISVESSKKHREKYEEIAKEFQNVVNGIPSGEWSSGVNECGEKLNALYKKTAVQCKSVALNSGDGDETKALSELLSTEEMNAAINTVLEEDLALFEELSSSEAELSYLEQLSLEKFKNYDQLVAQPLNRVTPIEELRAQMNQLNAIDVLKAQKHFQEYQQVAELFQQSLKNMQNSNAKEDGRNGNEDRSRQLLDGQGVARASVEGPTLPEGLLSELRNAIESQIGNGELGLQEVSSRLNEQGFVVDGSSLGSSPNLGFSSFDGDTNTQGVLLPDSSRTGNSSALSLSEQARKNRLESRTKDILARMGDAVTKRDQSLEQTNQGLLSRKSSIKPNLVSPASTNGTSADVASSFSPLSSNSEQKGGNAQRIGSASIQGSKNSLRNKSSRLGSKKGSKKNGASGSREQVSSTRSSASRSSQRSSLDSKSEVSQIYSRYKGSSESYSSVLDEGQIHSKSSNIFDVISKRYIISGLKHLDNNEK